MDTGQRKRKRVEEEGTEGASTSSFISRAPTDVGSNQYDVFLSFRGSDTRKGFTDCLYRSLVKAVTIPGCVFRDENSIPIGEEFGLEILNAIAQSKISILVISENYASSKWCLHELVHIMDHKKSASHIVLPIFYKVAPSDVRHLKGNFGNAFHSRRECFGEKDIQKWQRALKEVSYLNGWESDKVNNGHEGELIERVVETVISKLQEDFQLNVPKQLVGLGGCLKTIMNWIDRPSINARMIGIYGMGGIGKTTLAKIIYNQLSNKFMHISFLPDVRETTKHHGIMYLQSQLISDILQSKHKVSRIDDGINTIKSRFKGKKVLILLDDIDDKKQLDALVGDRNWFMAGSLIIVTTRNEAVLDQSEFEVDHKYELNELNKEHALLLFNRHAFRMDHSPREFEGISHDIISTMGGLPLALEVVGSYLYNKTNQKVWEDVRKQLKNQPHRDVQKILRISYDALEDGHKQIFLDIVCFFIGGTSEYAMYMWEDCGFYPSQAIEELKLRCLIKIGDHGEFLVHDQLRDLGRSIFCQGQSLEKRTGPWDNDYKGVPRVLRRTLGVPCCVDDILWAAAASGTSNDKLLYEVRWLEWQVLESNSYLPPFNWHVPKLSVLMLWGSGVTQDWKEWSSFMASKRLKILMFKFCPNLRSTPDLSAFTQLKILNLSGCSALEHLHPSIGKLTSLVSLDLSHCEFLKELPQTIGKLTSLVSLDLNNCGHLKELPQAIGKLTSLVSLDLSDCKHLKELPQEVGELKDLEELYLANTAITEIPTSIGSLMKLKKLVAPYCFSLREIPSSIGDLQNLQHLELSFSAIKKLPSAIGDLQNLQHLDLDCSAIKKLPSAIGSLRKLEKLGTFTCSSLREIPISIGDLQNLQHLDLGYSAIEKLPSSIGSLRKLEKLNASGCRSLREIPSSIGDLQNLQHLDLSGSAIEKLSSEICDLPSLQILDIGRTSISDLPESIRNLSSLQSLQLYGCTKLCSLPELPSGLTNLAVCCQSPTLPQLSSLIHLKELWLHSCDLLEDIPELSSRLLKLTIFKCDKLILLKLDQFKYLEDFSMIDCSFIERLDLSCLNHLKKLKVEDCDNLVEIQGPDGAKFLEPSCQRLQHVEVQYCKKLTQLRDLKILI